LIAMRSGGPLRAVIAIAELVRSHIDAAAGHPEPRAPGIAAPPGEDLDQEVFPAEVACVGCHAVRPIVPGCRRLSRMALARPSVGCQTVRARSWPSTAAIRLMARVGSKDCP